MGIKEAYQLIASSIHPLYDLREARNIADLVMEKLTGWERSKRIIHADMPLTDDQQQKFDLYLKELMNGKPVQYVLGEAWFYGMPFHVNEHVLIPRPETEELVDTIRKEQELRLKVNEKKTMLDIGTGSGCIAISLKKTFPAWDVWAIDESHQALDVAIENAYLQESNVHFKETDILHADGVDHFPAFDLIVSNPPYIPLSDASDMAKHVLDHEPHKALFVTDNDPMQFYKAIIHFAEKHLVRGGCLYFETHADYAQDVVHLMEEDDFEEIEIIQDMQGKERIVRGKKSGASL